MGEKFAKIPQQDGKSTAAGSTSCFSGNKGNAAYVGIGSIEGMQPLSTCDVADLQPLSDKMPRKGSTLKLASMNPTTARRTGFAILRSSERG
jgi:hypothetical protein